MQGDHEVGKGDAENFSKAIDKSRRDMIDCLHEQFSAEIQPEVIP